MNKDQGAEEEKVRRVKKNTNVLPNSVLVMFVSFCWFCFHKLFSCENPEACHINVGKGGRKNLSLRPFLDLVVIVAVVIVREET